MAFWAVQRMSGAQAGAAWCAGAIALDPDLLSSIPKLWGTEATVACLLAMLLACLALQRKAGPWALVSAGAVWGLSLTIRPNMALMVLPIGYALWLAYGKGAAVRTLADLGPVTV